MKRVRFLLFFVVMFIVTSAKPVSACVFTYDDYKKTGEVHSFIVGDYVFDSSKGFAPSLEDFAIAARSIPTDQDEYVYEIMNLNNLNIYSQKEIFGGRASSKTSDWPSFFNTKYNYRTNININNADYDIFTCVVDNIKINYTLLSTKGEQEYKTEASRMLNIQSTETLGSAKYCLTTGTTCEPTENLTVSGTGSSNIVDYVTNELPQRVCAIAFDEVGNSSGIVCDNVTVKVDSEPIKINPTDEFESVIQGAPSAVDGLFDVEYSVSKGNVYYFYYDNDRKYILSNMSDLPNGTVTVEAIGQSGSGLITEETREIDVRKSVVTYNYSYNGGTSVQNEKLSVAYQSRADLTNKATREGYEFIGWNTDKDADFGLNSIRITEDTTLYAIFKRELKATFEIYDLKGRIPAVSEYDEMTCTIYNKETNCSVVVPNISPRVQFEALGWSDEKDKTVEYNGGDILELTDDKTIYSVTRDKTPVTGTFYVPTGDPENPIDKVISQCYLYNGEETCKLDIPENLIGGSGTPGSGGDNGISGISKKEDEIDPATDEDLKSGGGDEYYPYIEEEHDIEFTTDDDDTIDNNVDDKKKGNEYHIITDDKINDIKDKITVPDLPEKDGWEKDGWRKDDESKPADIKPGDEIEVDEDATYHGVYKKKVKLSYVADGATGKPEDEEKYVYYNTASKKVSKASFVVDGGSKIKKNTYIFKGWKDEINQDVEQGVTIEINENKTLTAQWTQNATLIVFDYQTNGGTSVDRETITYIAGDPAINVSNIIANKKGYDFVGWSKFKESNSSTMVTYRPEEEDGLLPETVTLYAIFKRTINITFRNTNSDNLQVNAGVKTLTIYNNDATPELTLPEVQSLSSNVEFLGWSKNIKAITPEYHAGDEVAFNDNTTLYTIFKSSQTFKTNYIYYEGSERKTKTVECTVYNGETSCETSFNPTGVIYEDANLIGWSASSTQVIQENKQKTYGTANYYAIYKKYVTVTYNSGSNLDNTVSTVVTRTVPIQYLTTTGTPTMIKGSVNLETPDGISGFTTLGWRTDKTASTPQYRVNNTFQVTGNITFNAVYNKTITITYAALGGAPTPGTESKTIYYNSGITNPRNEATFIAGEAPFKTGMNLNGWLVDNDPNKKFNPGTTVNLAKSSTLYANWEPREYNVTLNGTANGGVNPTNNVIILHYEEMMNLPLYTATKPGYEFVGWAVSPNSKEVLTEYQIPAEDTTLYAVYKKKLTATWTIFHTAASSQEAKQTSCYIYNNETSCKVQAGVMDTNAGYTAVGWSYTRGSTDVNAGLGLQISLTTDKQLWSVTKTTQDVVGTFYYYDGNVIKNTTSSCALYNGASVCNLDLPDINKSYLNATFVNWSSTPTSYTAASITGGTSRDFYAYYKQISQLKYYSGTFIDSTNNTIGENIATVISCSNPVTDTYTIEYIANKSNGWANVPVATLRTPTSISDTNALGATQTYTTLGWRQDLQMTTPTLYAGGTLTMNKSYELYSVYNRTITLSYNSQGATTTPASQTATQYYNSGSGKTNHTFTLPAAVSKAGYTYHRWRKNSVAGDAYLASSQITILEDTTMHAYFTVNPIITNTYTTQSGEWVYQANEAINFDKDNTGKYTYYFKSSRAGFSTAAVSQCGNGANPDNCSGSTTNISAGYWYKASANLTVYYATTLTVTGSLEARSYHDGYYSTTTQSGISKVDRTPPSANTSKGYSSGYTGGSVTASITCTDAHSGAKSGSTSQSFSSSGTLSTTCTDNVGNSSTQSVSVSYGANSSACGTHDCNPYQCNPHNCNERDCNPYQCNCKDVCVSGTDTYTCTKSGSYNSSGPGAGCSKPSNAFNWSCSCDQHGSGYPVCSGSYDYNDTCTKTNPCKTKKKECSTCYEKCYDTCHDTCWNQCANSCWY